jgi:hypothetical protein
MNSMNGFRFIKPQEADFHSSHANQLLGVLE